jgi:5-methylcytosine-specific restriction endonuclease McrA
VRRWHLRRYPFCNRCRKPAALVHHIVSLAEGGDRFDSKNLQSLCAKCHTAIHSRGRK